MEYRTTAQKHFGLGELPTEAINYMGGDEPPQKAPAGANQDKSKNSREAVKTS